MEEAIEDSRLVPVEVSKEWEASYKEADDVVSAQEKRKHSCHRGHKEGLVACTNQQRE